MHGFISGMRTGCILSSLWPFKLGSFFLFAAVFFFYQEGLLRQKNQLDAYVAWHRQQGLAPSLDEMMSMPSTNERWAQEGRTGGLKGAPKVTVILNLFMREVSTVGDGRLGGGGSCSLGGDGLRLLCFFFLLFGFVFRNNQRTKGLSRAVNTRGSNHERPRAAE